MAKKIAESLIPGDTIFINVPGLGPNTKGKGFDPLSFELTVDANGVGIMTNPAGDATLRVATVNTPAAGPPPTLDLNAYMAIKVQDGPEEVAKAQAMFEAHLDELDAYNTRLGELGNTGATFTDRLLVAAVTFLRQAAGIKGTGEAAADQVAISTDKFIVRLATRATPETPGVFVLQPTPVWGDNARK